MLTLNKNIDPLNDLSPLSRTSPRNLPLRRDMVALLAYLRDHRVIGTQTTGKLTAQSHSRGHCSLRPSPGARRDNW